MERREVGKRKMGRRKIKEDGGEGGRAKKKER